MINKIKIAFCLVIGGCGIAWLFGDNLRRSAAADGTLQSGGQQEGQHWAFVAPRRPALPAVKNKTWGQGPIDQFILAKIEEKGLTPSPPASRRTLIRRLSLDLTGLPPTPKEIDDFLADQSPD